ncbi:MAG: hypothetical protein JWP75_3396 [Frondihabitans sp.]|nr:hypothetical protein [Frondihabitans sp.]
MPRRFLFISDLVANGRDDRWVRRAESAGDLVRVRRGVYLAADDHERLDKRWRHIAAVTALVSRIRTPIIVSHLSAAALWGFPDLDGWPAEIHVIDPARTTGKRTTTVARHPGPVDTGCVLRRGILCTGAARTAVDVGLVGGFLPALLAFDYGLRANLFSMVELEIAVAARPGARGVREVREALHLASAGSESAGESISKGTMHRLGFPRPLQQKRFRLPGGRSAYVDFWWESEGIVGEFDGDQKYLDPALRQGRSIERTLLQEKERSDAVSALPEVRNLVRWKYATARNPSRLEEVLRSAGLPQADAPRSGREWRD